MSSPPPKHVLHEMQNYVAKPQQQSNQQESLLAELAEAMRHCQLRGPTPAQTRATKCQIALP
ncbi:hypothetical protein E4U43_000970, partial [Claviceps pusilla]